MHSLHVNIKKFQAKPSVNRRTLQPLEPVEEDPSVPPSSPRDKIHSDPCVTPLFCPSRYRLDTVDCISAGESLPRFHRRSQKRSRTLNTKLIEAIKRQDKFAVQELLNQGANPNASCYNDYISACHLAALAGGGTLPLLQARNALMTRTDRLGRTPLHFAAWEGNIAEIAILLNIPIGIQNKIKHHVSTDVAEEIKSINSSFQELVNVRCELGNVTQEYPDDWLNNVDHNCSQAKTHLPLLQPGWTPLHAASANARHQSVRLLLAAGSDPNVRDFMGRSALNVAGFAYYNGQHINPNNFTEVIKLLLQANPNNHLNSNLNLAKGQNTPLHTAVEVGSVDAITELLAAGACLLQLNRDGLTPMHLCVKKNLKEHLQVLLYSGNNHSENVVAAIDALDKDGRTILHTAVLSNWAPGVCVALEMGANITAKANDGETPLHLAAALGNLDILSEILSVININEYIDYQNKKHETALFKAIINGHIDCVKRLLKDGASITMTMPKEFNVFHAAASLGFTKILKVLLDHDYLVTRMIINFQTTDREDGKGFGPLHYAVSNNHPECVKLLLSMNAYVSLRTTYGDDRLSTPLHIAAMKNNLEIAKILVTFDSNTVHDVNNFRWTPLHTACRYKSREVIVYLLREGADLAAITSGPDKFRKTAVDMIMNNLSKPTEFMEDVFDSYVYSNDLNLHDPNCKVTVDYSILGTRSDLPEKSSDDTLSKTYDMRQITVIEAIIGTGNRQKQNRLLVHPLIESFLYFKWRALLPFFYMMIVVYSLFVLSLTVVILSPFFYNDKCMHIPPLYNPKPWSCVVLATLIILIPQEACYYKFSRKYFRQLESWIKLTTILLALIITISNTNALTDVVWYRHVSTMALLLSWVELMFLLSGFPKWGYYVPMFRKVTTNVLKILLTFMFLIIGFALSFMIEFHEVRPFEDPFAAIVKTMVMMTSEFDYDDLIEKIFETKGLATSLLTVRIVFVGFLIFAAIVLMNLMVGVAVNDLQNLELLGNIRRIKKQVDFLAFLENMCNLSFHRGLMTCVLKKIMVKKSIILRPSEQSCEYNKKLPAHIRDAIFDIAQAKKQHTDEEFGAQCYNKKIEEMYKVIVTSRKDDVGSKIPYVLVEKNQDGIDGKLESLVSELKMKLDLYFERTQLSIELLDKKTDDIIKRLEEVYL